ncbi:hypothetical protein E2C01_057713 [Portunus trituberculatus]|uniref:Uncharacterized protein n=1 Tax=Portunus trituberculatus TaxID=210409 RepID=A0A5B7GXS1_PORTR|nr:hypothetical protein [Portunus trituberculatus]
MTTGTTQTRDTSLYTSPQEGKTSEALKTPSLAISQGHVLCVVFIHVSLEVALLSGPTNAEHMSTHVWEEPHFSEGKPNTQPYKATLYW